MPEGRGTARTYPFVAPGVPAFLFFQAFFEKFHQLVPAVLFNGGLFVGRQVFLKFLDQPVQGDFRTHVGGKPALELFVEFTEGLVVTVVKGFVLDQRHARQMIEVGQCGRHDRSTQRAKQGQVFLDGHWQAVRPQMVEEICQHDAGPVQRSCLASAWRESKYFRWCETSGHSPAVRLYITVSRTVPSRRKAWWRRTPSRRAPRRSMARCDAKLKLSVRQPTTPAPSVSKACPSSSNLHAVFTWVR